MDELRRPQRGERDQGYANGRVRPRPSFSAPRTVFEEAKGTTQENQHKPVDGISKAKTKKVERTVSKAKPALPRLHRSLVLKRHMVERADHHRKEARQQHKRHFASVTVGMIIILALGVISWAFWDMLPGLRSISIPFLSKQDQQTTVPDLSRKQKSNLDENKPSAGEVEVYQSAADAPRILKIPKLEVEARVKRVGSSLGGEPISPTNIYDVGWFDDSSKPGQPGAMLINGHTTGSTKNGVFYELGNLQIGDEVVVEKGDRTSITYIVSKVQKYTGDQLDASTTLQSIDSSKNGLNLITSTANYGGGVNQSQQRVIVFALQR